MNRFIDTVIKHHRPVLAVILMITLPLGYFYSRQKFFNNVDIYFDRDDPQLISYKEFQKTYGNEELVVAAFSDTEIMTVKNLRVIRDISTALKGRRGVQRVFSLTEAREAVSDGDTVSFRNIINMDRLDDGELSRLRRKVLADPILVNNLISADGRTAAIVVELVPIGENLEKFRVINDLRDTALKAAGTGVDLRFAGQPLLESYMNELTKRDNLRFTPVMLLFIFFILRIMLKKYGLGFLVLATLLVTIAWTIGILTICGETMNMTTVIIPPVLLAISVADAIHILSHYRDIYILNGHRHVEAVKSAVRAVWFPCLFTSLTTGIGFFSFITASLRPPKIVGIFTSLGVAIAYLLTIIMLPSALTLLKKLMEKGAPSVAEEEAILSETRGELSPFARRLMGLGSRVTEHSRFITLSLVIISAVALYGMFQLRIETSFASYLPENDRLRQDIEYIDKNLGGTIPLVILIRARESTHDFTHPESLELLSDIQKELMKDLPHFTSTFSVADYFREINRAFNNGEEAFYRIPRSRTDVMDYYELAEADIIDHAVSPDMMEARLSFQSRWGSNALAKKYHAIITRYMNAKLGTDYTYRITSLSSLYISMGENLQRSQIRSFLTAFIIIFIMMYFVCRNIPLTIISMIPNLFPIMITLGLMGLMDIPLDIATIMIASVVIGIAVDDTIHYIVWFRRSCAEGKDLREALVGTYGVVGKPIVMTSVVLTFGFFILILGAVRPTQTFGVLTAFSMAMALLGDLVLLPALILFFRPPVSGREKSA